MFAKLHHVNLDIGPCPSTTTGIILLGFCNTQFAFRYYLLHKSFNGDMQEIFGFYHIVLK